MILNISRTTWTRLIFLISGLCILSGCANPSVKGNLLSAKHVSQLTQWQATGKLAFITPADKQAVNFVWLQNNDEYKVNFNTFLGINVLSIKRDKLGIIISAEGKDYQSKNPQQLIFDLTGWWLPIDELSRWLKADIDSEEGDVTKDNKGYIQSYTPNCRETLCSENIMIHYSQYQPVAHLILPHRLTMQTQGMAQQTLKVSIQHWR